MKSKYTFLIIMCVVICGLSSAQLLPKQRKVWLPEYIADTYKAQSDWTKDQKWQDWAVAKIKNNDFGRSSTVVWKVFSDRANNKTYVEPRVNSTVHSTLKFMEQLYVAEIRNGFALVYKTEIVQFDMDIPNDAISFGWISVDNLLLWDECPLTHSRIYQKALVVHDPAKHGSTAEKNPPFYMEPDKEARVNPLQRAKDLEIYFVMKTAQIGNVRYYLLSTGMLIGNNTQIVYGWIPDEYITEWNDRLLIEPAYSSRAVEHYKSKNIFPSIFHEMEDARQIWTNEKMQNPLWLYRDFSPRRMHEYAMRNPILQRAEVASDILHVASISSIAANDTDPELIKRMELMKQARDNINVIFVIDATSSMKPYFQSVADALTNIMRRDYKYQMKTGVVLYKGYKDSDNIEYTKLTNKMDDIYSFVSQHQNKIRTSSSEDYTAMFLGLETALDMRKMGYESSQTNFIILIGNAGNNRTDPSGVNWLDKAKQLSQKMFDNNINFLAYQVNHAGSTPYDDFATQIGRLQRELANKYQNKIKSGELEYKLQTNRLYALSRKGSSNELPIYNSYKYASDGQSETISGLQNLITGNISDFHDFVFRQLTLLEANTATATSGETGYLVEQQLTEILRLLDFNEKDIESYISYLRDGGTTKFLGYAPIKTSKSQHKLFEYVLFFTQNELEELIHQLSRINESYVVSEPKAFQDAIIRMGQAMLGQLSEDDIRNMDMDKLLGQIYGIPVTLNLCGLDIKRIPNMDRDDLRDYITVFRQKIENLKRINADSNYNGRFQRNRTTYYWIPMDDMPGIYDDCSKIRIR